jgi:RNA polymerase sigma-70 factor, ECF subfamily
MPSGGTHGVQLIHRMAVGDREAFSVFYDRYAPLVYPLVLRIVREPADAADVLQQVFLESWQGAAAYDPERGSPEAWMVTRARTRAIDRVRSVRRRGKTVVPMIDESMAEAPGDPPVDRAEQAEDRALVTGALGHLPDGQRQVIELAYYGGLTQSEIAERLGQPLGTVKTRMRLGLERLREIVGPKAR